MDLKHPHSKQTDKLRTSIAEIEKLAKEVLSKLKLLKFKVDNELKSFDCSKVDSLTRSENSIDKFHNFIKDSKDKVN